MRWLLIGLAVWLAGVVGCGPSNQAAVRGQVTLDGVPLPDVEVQFIPDREFAESARPVSAYTNEQGEFQTSIEPHSGMVAGQYRVCLNDARVMMPGAGIDATSGELDDGVQLDRAPRARVRVPPRYSDAGQTPFQRVEIEVGEQTRDFALSTRR
jgi:hypothetical protein